MSDLCSSSCGDQIILLAMINCSEFLLPLLLFGGVFHNNWYIVMASKTTTTKFEVEKLNRKNNFLLWKMRVMLLLVKEGTHKTLLSTEKKPSKMENDDEWVYLDV